MAAPAKYLFDRSFEQVSEAPSPEQVLRSEFDAELAAAREAALAQGREEGMQAAQETNEASISTTLSQVLKNFTAMQNELTAAQKEMRSEAVQIALAAAEAMATELVRRQPLASLEALFKECLEYSDNPPHIAIRVNEGLVDELQTRIGTFAKQQGFQGEIVLVGDPEIPVGDARLEWADGGVGREMDVARSRVIKTVTDYLDGQGAASAGS